jgi:hypothetical protein
MLGIIFDLSLDLGLVVTVRNRLAGIVVSAERKGLLANVESGLHK